MNLSSYGVIMSRIGLKHIAGYQGLALGKGPQTFSTSPLWSPGGAYMMPSSSYQGFYGEADGADQNEGKKSLLKKFTDAKIMGYSLPLVLAIGYGAYYFLGRKKKMTMLNPLKKIARRMNPFKGSTPAHKAAGMIRHGNKKKGAELLRKYYRSKGIRSTAKMSKAARYGISSKKRKTTKRKTRRTRRSRR